MFSFTSPHYAHAQLYVDAQQHMLAELGTNPAMLRNVIGQMAKDLGTADMDPVRNSRTMWNLFLTN